ncbi:restriction endonuclease subunit S [Sphingobacterium sp. PU5-4]|uniref:Restriction endonuclease subunit S n=1 Tax=Sphingobacterium tenebrionis TaxID=3111775 RepID=A0ABU8I6T2_9SPHI
MSLKFKFVPLTFLKDEVQIKHQIRNTIILRYLFDKYNATTKLKHLISGTQYGYNASALKSGNNKFLRISDITDGKVNWNDVPYCDCTDEKTYLLHNNDLLIARTGGTTGKSFLISNPPKNAIYAGYLIRIQANNENNPEFINLFLNSYIYWSQIVSLNKGEFRPSVNAEKLKSLIVPKVNTNIQNDVVRISIGEKVKGYEDLFLAIDNALSDYDKTKEISSQIEIQKKYYENIKQAILQEAIQGKLTKNWRVENPNVEPASELLKRIKAEKAKLIKEKKIKKEKELAPISKEETPFEIPENWVWVRLGEIAKYVQRGKSPKYVDYSSVPVISQKCVQWNKFEFHKARFIDEQTLDKYEEERFLRNGDLLWNSTGDGTVGRLIEFVNETNYDKIVADSHVAVIRFMPSITSSYILFHLSSKLIQDNLIVSGSTKQTELSRSTVLNTMIPLPPLCEQQAIVEKVKSLMVKYMALEQEIAQSEQYANMLMQAVLKEAFESKMAAVESVQMDRSIQLALMQMMFKQNLGINYGEVIMQKTAYNLDHLYHKESSFFPYSYQSSNHGAFSVQLRLELESNPYLTTQSTEKGKVLCLEPKQKTTVLDAFSNPVYKDYIQSLTQLLEIYSLPIIGKKSNQIELFNTVLKIMNDLGTDKIDEIYASMENWEIEQKGYKTKAEKFSKIDTEKILDLVVKLRKQLV